VRSALPKKFAEVELFPAALGCLAMTFLARITRLLRVRPRRRDGSAPGKNEGTDMGGGSPHDRAMHTNFVPKSRDR
jgi:hypothetical protein